MDEECLAKLTIIGTIMIKIGTGISTSWGIINIYVYSYFYEKGFEIDKNTNSIIILCFAIPSFFGLFAAPKLAYTYGFEKIIKTSAFIFLISPLISRLSFNFYTVVIFCYIIPILVFQIGAVSLFHCIWSHFESDIGKVTGLSLFFFGVGEIIWGFLISYLINPENRKATITDQNSNQTFFQFDIVNNSGIVITILFAFAGLLFFGGSWLIKKKETEEIMEREIQWSPVLKEKQFILLFLICLISFMFQNYLKTNSKLIFMPQFQDDHFITFVVQVANILSVFGALLWGFLTDKLGISRTLLIFSFLDCFGKIFLSFSSDKIQFFISYLIVGSTQKTMYVLFSFGLNDLYGLDMATKLIPFRGIGLFFGLILAPVFSMLLSEWVNRADFLKALGIFNLLIIVMSVGFKKVYEERMEIKEEESDYEM